MNKDYSSSIRVNVVPRLFLSSTSLSFSMILVNNHQDIKESPKADMDSEIRNSGSVK